ncbi:hypothetical protein B0H11DRAFT_1755337 [Mycena galericulata]|nr:hypothetical protein B0H11DRAFT_1755337 [Mycena galericulata]
MYRRTRRPHFARLSKPKACYKYGLEGHISRDCPDNTSGAGAFSSSSGGGGAAGTECYRYGKVGHIARACPEAGYGGGGAFSSSGGGGGGGAGKTCYTCGGVGHMSRDCVQGSKCYNCVYGRVASDAREIWSSLQ